MRSTFHDQMPELPEVQTIVNDLQKIVGDSIVDFFSDFKKAIKDLSIEEFAKEIKNQKIANVSRLGKIIIIELANGKFVAIHLKMTGKLLVMNHKTWNMKHNEDKPKHLHHIFFLKKNGAIEFHDVRKFATISLLNSDNIATIKENYGIDPVNDVFLLENLSFILEKGKNKTIKETLMNNSLILGIGNIYASEILFDAKILPSRKSSALNEKEIKTLHSSIKKILAKAIKMRGTSVSDYRDSAGKKGSFQNELKVYKKSGQNCLACGTMVAKITLGQRSTFYCPKCQH